jgi:hypothetical protein
MSKLVDLLTGRAGIAGVQWVLYGAPMRKLLRRTLGQMLESSGQLGRCHLRRAKFKPGRTLTAYYDVTLHEDHSRGEHRSGRTIRPIAVTWSLPDPVASETLSTQRLDGRDMQTEAALRGLSMPFQELAGVAPAWGMSVQVSPLDVRFPQLVRVSNPDYRCRLLENGVRTGTGAYTVTPIRYRPGQRHVLRYDPVGTPGRTGSRETLFAKLYADHRGERLFPVANWGADQLAQSGSGITGLRPLAYIAADALILYPFVAGVPLTQHLRRPRRNILRYLYQAGTALRSLHDAQNVPISALKTNDLAAEVKATARASEHVHALLPTTGTRIGVILEQIQTLSMRLDQEPPTFTHGDFKVDHLLIHRDKVTLIDFDTCALADPALDIGKLLADLQWWYTAYKQPGLTPAQESFLAGYGLHATDPRLHRARLYEVLWLVKISLRRVRLFDPAWHLRTAQMLALAEALLRAVKL